MKTCRKEEEGGRERHEFRRSHEIVTKHHMQSQTIQQEHWAEQLSPPNS